MEGQDTIPSVFGPMSNSLNGIKTFMQAVIGASPWTRDPLAVRKKWDEEAYQLSEHGGGKQLCFAIMWDDGRTIPHPPIHRALDIAKAALVEAGHKGMKKISQRCLVTLIWLALQSSTGSP